MNIELVRPLAFLSLPLLAGLAGFVVGRRPRQAYSWAFAGIVSGFFIFYTGNAILMEPGLSLEANYLWQRIQIFSAWLAMFSAIGLAYTLHQTPLVLWEKAVVLIVVVRGVIDVVWIATVQPRADRSCFSSLTGHPALMCREESQIPAIATLTCALLLATLFVRAAFTASGRHYQILRRYLWLAVACAVGASVINHLALLLDILLLPSEIPTLIGATVATRMLLFLEQDEQRLPPIRWDAALFLWLLVLIIAMLADTLWLGLPLPVLTLTAFAMGVAVAAAWVLSRYSFPGDAASAALPAIAVAPTIRPSEPLSLPPATSPQEGAAVMPPVRIHLFGPMRVYRQGELLPNTAAVWRAHKTRSLLAYLALRGQRGATTVELVNALWPLQDELDEAQEQKALAALRSYISTLRKVLEPEGKRASQRFVVNEDRRYYLCTDDQVWVDVWAFEDLARQSEYLQARGDLEAAIAAWQETLALYHPEGLLPDDVHLPAEVLETERMALQRRWLHGLRTLGRYYAAGGQRERAVMVWEQVHAAEPWDAEAAEWLARHRAA